MCTYLLDVTQSLSEVTERLSAVPDVNDHLEYVEECLDPAAEVDPSELPTATDPVSVRI